MSQRHRSARWVLCVMAGCGAGLAAAGLAAAPAAEKAPAAPAKAEPPAPAPAWLKSVPYKIVYETYRDGNWELFMVSADGSGPVNLTKTADVDELYPHVSPDGTKISFMVNVGKGEATRRGAWYMSIDGSGRTKVADDAREACWSPDGKSIAILKAEFPTRYVHEDFATKGVAIFDLATGKMTDHPNNDLHHLYNLCWAPDGNWFVATVHGGMGYKHAILAMEARGTKVVDLKLPGCRPDLSADGKRIAWGSDDWNLNTADIDFGGAQPIVRNQRTTIKGAEPNKVYHIDWSPDGKFVAFSRGLEQHNLGAAPEIIGIKAKGWNICVGNVATGEWAAITTDGNCNKEPDWAPARQPSAHGTPAVPGGDAVASPVPANEPVAARAGL